MALGGVGKWCGPLWWGFVEKWAGLTPGWKPCGHWCAESPVLPVLLLGPVLLGAELV